MNMNHKNVLARIRCLRDKLLSEEEEQLKNRYRELDPYVLVQVLVYLLDTLEIMEDRLLRLEEDS